MADPKRPVAHEATVPEILTHLVNVNEMLAEQGLEAPLAHLIQLRASQINRCAFCVKMHTRDARKDGETDARLDRLVVWDHVDDFSAKEKAVFAWTEALTTLDPKTDYGALREHLRAHLSDQQISVVTVAVGMINLWNRIGISSH